MKKNSFIKGVIILTIGSILTRIIGLFIRIVFTRIIKEEGISLYNIIMPTYVLVVNLTTLGLPLAISMIISKQNYRGKNIILSTYPFVFLINILMMFTLIICSSFISNVLLKSNVKNLIISLSLTIPFISISSLLRGYFLGKQKMSIIAIANILEQILRLLLILLILPIFMYKPIITQVSVYILFGIISETFTIIFFLLCSPKKLDLKLNDFKPDLEITEKVCSYSIPTISSRVISNIILFLEPILLMHILTFKGYTPNYIRLNYGIYNAYVLSILTMPSLIINSITTSLIPEISKNSSNKKFVKKRLKESIRLTLFISCLFYFVILINPSFILKLLYNTSKGTNYIKTLSIFFILFNLTGPMTAVLNGLGFIKQTFKASVKSSIIKTILMIILSFIFNGLTGFILSEIISILVLYILLLKLLKEKKLL